MSDTSFGKYRLLAELGRGGMADVYLAASTGLGGFQKLVVIKISRMTDDPAFSQMFLDEARLTARLSHANVVQTYEVGEEAGRQYIVMEYLDGASLFRLNRLAAPQGGVPLRTYVQLLSHVLAGLDYAHNLKDFDGTLLNVVHRDLSPQNLMVTTQGLAKVLDFGIAKTSDSRTMTHVGFYRGKLNYMSPEQALAEAPVDARADIFSIGVLLAEGITKKPFWGDASTAVISTRLVQGNIPDIEAAGIEPILEEICANALHPDREKRTKTAREFKEALDWYLSTTGGPVSHEEISAFITPLVAEDRLRVNALIERSLKSGESLALPNVPQSTKSSPASAFAATITPFAAASARGSGMTPPAAMAPSSATPGAAPVPSAPTAAAADVAPAPAPAPNPDLQPTLPDLQPTLPPPASPSLASIPPLDRSVRSAARTPEAPGSKRGLWVVGGLGGAVVAAALAFSLRSAPAPKPEAPPAAVEVAKVTPPPVLKPMQRVAITTDPAGAVLLVDGAAVANPFTTDVLDGKPHQVEVRAPAHEPLAREVVFDRDQTISLALKPIAEVKVEPPPPTAGGSEPAPPPTPAPVAAVRRPPPPKRSESKTKAESASVAAPATAPANDGIQELPVNKPKQTGKRTLDTDVFEEQQKKEIDRSSPWEK